MESLISSKIWFTAPSMSMESSTSEVNRIVGAERLLVMSISGTGMELDRPGICTGGGVIIGFDFGFVCRGQALETGAGTAMGWGGITDGGGNRFSGAAGLSSLSLKRTSFPLPFERSLS
ncbi:hypothetical protein M408DRAFT_333916 [Serendipita vermifera MAFF 305830]|uniref:Uncharacterized protein n=1 Tax=Serendipita vermifera MAFF 305830 TaxID=933852 RepID=A0A0C3AMT1_SERVB|nr:hypothetical protein M408DRAFT_333916 [Serendipita vermifera MAFF 305830]